MQEKSFIIRDPLGLHARPAGLLVKEAQKYSCEITLRLPDKEKSASLKKLFAVLALEARAGDLLQLETSGEDESKALAAVGALIEQTLG